MENPINLQKSFSKQLLEPIQAVDDFPQDIATQSGKIFEVLQTRIESAHAFLQAPGDATTEDLNRAFSINFFWVQSAKSFLLLCRDTLFEQQKADILTSDGLLDPQKRELLRKDGKALLLQAAKELVQSEAIAGEEMGPKEIRHCKLQHNPWPVYRQQMETISEQIEKIAQDHPTLLKVASETERLRWELDHTVEACHAEMHELKANIQEASQFIRKITKEDPDKGPAKIAARMPEFQGSIREEDYLKNLESRLEEIYPEIPERHNQVYGIRDGILLLDEIDFRRRIRLWLKGEILPLIYEIWELTDLRRRNAQMTYLNVSNWARILSDQGSVPENEVNFEEILLLFEDLEKTTEKAFSNLERLQQLSQERLSQFFQTHCAFIEYRPYLPIEVQSTINRLRKGQNSFVRGIVQTYKSQATKVKKFIQRIEREEALSNSEKIVRRIKERTGDPSNQQYTSIFLTKGFVGTSFTVGREEELKHAGQIVADWEKGYRGSILLTGERYSGKSLFAELIASNYFPEDTYRIEANSMLTVEGRKFSTGYDLTEVLEKIRKYKGSERCMLLVDDLENWWTDDTPIHESARQLSRFANLYNNHFFLVVTMGNSLLAHLEQTVDIRREFQSEMNLDQISSQVVREAILVRHGATHKKLLTDKGESLSPQQFRRLTNSIYTESRGNIGEALNLWALSTWKLDEEHVINKFERGHDLPDFLESDLGVLLATILLLRESSEFQLRHIFGPAFSSRYAPVVRRLLGVGVLRREINGRLEINPVLVNRLGQILEKQGYLKYLN